MMQVQSIQGLKSEEEELHRKREELAAIRTTLAERELELIDFRRELGDFERCCLRQSNVELIRWKARISWWQALNDPSPAARERARQGREEANQTSGDSKCIAVMPSAELRRLFKEVARRVHSDVGSDFGGLTRDMVETTRAYEAGDAVSLQQMLDNKHVGDPATDAGIVSAFMGTIYQIRRARARITAIKQDLAALRQSRIAALREQMEDNKREGREFLALLPTTFGELVLAKRESEELRHSKRRSLVGISSTSALEGTDTAASRNATCRRCGERDEPVAGSEDDGYCRWCRSREQEIAKIWNKWGCDEYGLPLDRVWDDGALRRDVQAKSEIDRRLEELGIGAHWIGMRCGFTKDDPYGSFRCTIQAWWLTYIVNNKWGFDSEGEPIGKTWDADAKGRRTRALKELKNILAKIGFPLMDHYELGALDPNEISVIVSPPKDVVNWCSRTCCRCGEPRELIFEGCVCSSCSDALDRQWTNSTAREWLLTRISNVFARPVVTEFIFLNTAYAEMKRRSVANGCDITRTGLLRVRQPMPDEFSLPILESYQGLYPSTIRPATPEELVAWREREDLIAKETARIIENACEKLGIEWTQDRLPPEDGVLRVKVAREIVTKLQQLGWLEELIKMKGENSTALRTIDHCLLTLLKMALQEHALQ
jgi:hypothetical protein